MVIHGLSFFSLQRREISDPQISDLKAQSKD